MKKIGVEEFKERWKYASKLLCPKLRADGYLWLYPVPEDPCKTGDCEFDTCHNYKIGWDKPDRILVPEKPLPQLLGEEADA